MTHKGIDSNRELGLNWIQNDRLNKARQKMFLDQIEPADFKIMKKDCEEAVSQLERKLVGMNFNRPKSIDGLVEKGIGNLLMLDRLFESCSNEERRQLVGSIFPNNLTFDKMVYRTEKVNEVVNCIYMIN